MSDATDYGVRILRDPPDFGRNGFDLMGDMLKAPAHLQEDKKFWREAYTYLSPNRPIASIAGAKAFGEFRYLGRWLFTEEPLSIEVVAQFELVPNFTHGTRGLYIIALANSMKTPVELANESMIDEHTRVAMLFKNPRGKWQLSFFEAGVGPIGHEEGETGKSEKYDWMANTPENMVERAYSHGYRYFYPGTLDSIAETFPTPEEMRKQWPGYSGR